jgi:hypothetical protein
MRLEDDGEDLVWRGIRLRNDAPHPEFVQNLDEGLMVVLPQGGVKLSEHCQLDLTEIRN